MKFNINSVVLLESTFHWLTTAVGSSGSKQSPAQTNHSLTRSDSSTSCSQADKTTRSAFKSMFSSSRASANHLQLSSPVKDRCEYIGEDY